MDRLEPFETLEKDYYLGDRGGWYSDGEDRDSESSDDEMMATLSRLAGVRRECGSSSKGAGKRKAVKEKDEFESSMDNELDERFVAHSARFMVGPASSSTQNSAKSASTADAVGDDEEMPSLETDSEDGEEQKATPTVETSSTPSGKIPSSILRNVGTSGKASLRDTSTESPKPKKSVSIKEEPDRIEESSGANGELAAKPNEAEGKPAFDEKDNVLRRAATKVREQVGEESVDFYDPDEDDCNERWVREHRQRLKIIPKRNAEPKDGGSGDGETSAGDHRDDAPTDAVLSCPACMSVLTRDCQRHELYRDQYRAIFVENCKVIVDQTLFLPQSRRRSKKKKSKLVGQAEQQLDVRRNTTLSSSEVASCLVGVPKEDLFHPVQCEVCSTSVGVTDSEEIYHFFNVLTGYS